MTFLVALPFTQVIVFFALGVGEGVAVTDGVGEGDALAVGVGVGVGVADGVGVGVGVAITTGAGFGSDDPIIRPYPSSPLYLLEKTSMTTVELSAIPSSTYFLSPPMVIEETPRPLEVSNLKFESVNACDSVSVNSKLLFLDARGFNSN